MGAVVVVFKSRKDGPVCPVIEGYVPNITGGAAHFEGPNRLLKVLLKSLKVLFYT